jgi:hypothetical protein
MKNKFCRLLILILTSYLLSIPEICLAGQRFKPGFIVMNQGDTIRGELAVQGEFSSSKSCIFRQKAKKPLRVFRPFEIKCSVFNAGERYVSAVLPESGDSVFLRLVLDGEIDLLSREDYRSISYYYLQKDSLPLVNLYYFEQPVSSLFQDTGRIRTNYQTSLYRYTDDCPPIKGQVRLVKGPNYPELYRVIHRYQRFMNPTEPLILYANRTKKHPFFEIGYGLSSPSHYSLNYFFPAPILPNFIFVGVGYDSYYGIPLQIRLRYPIYFIQPEIGAGIDFFPGFPLSNTFNQWTVGLSLKLSRFSIGYKYTNHFTKWFPFENWNDKGLIFSYQF